MQRERLTSEEFRVRPFPLFKDRWMLLTAGEHRPGQFNTMTIAWGALGVMWEKPFAMVVVRPNRHTFTFLERSPDFTLSVLPESFRETLLFCGTHSGRDTDKIKEAGLTPVPSVAVKSPAFDEAELIVECRKTYSDDFDPARFKAPYIERLYNGRDYHRLFFGEILAMHATEAYRHASA